MPWTLLTFEPDPNPQPRAVSCDHVDDVLDAIAQHVFDYEEAKARDGKRMVRGRAGGTAAGAPHRIVLRVAPTAGLTEAQRESLRERLRDEGPNFDLTISYEDSGLDA